MSRKFIWIILMGLCTSLVARAQISESLPKAIEQMKEVPVYTSFPFGAIKPVGWLKTQMQADLNGFVGNLDKLVPDLINDPISFYHRICRWTAGFVYALRMANYPYDCQLLPETQ